MEKTKKSKIKGRIPILSTPTRSLPILLFMMFLIPALSARTVDKVRVIILTDVDGKNDKSGSGCPEGDDSDDHASLVRLMVHANEFDIEGIHATTNSDGQVRPCPEIIRNVINLYGQVRENLKLHASGWPTTQYLLDRVKVGYNGNRMASSVGDDKSTESSNHIIEVVDTAMEDSDPRPIWIISWDGLVSLAQALWDISNDRTADEINAFVSEIRVYTITEDTDVGPWIRKNFPNLFYIWADRGSRNTFWGSSRGGNESLFNRSWWSQNIQNNHGVLGADYVDASSHLPEGDTPSLLYLMTFTGLNDPYNPEYGGWGGRYTWQKKDGSMVFSDAHPGDYFQGDTDCPRSVWRWRPKYQNEFAARMDWCVKSYEEANHPPMAVFNGRAGIDPVILEVKKNETVSLSAKGSSDPDGNTLSYKWYVYPEAGTCRADVSISKNTSRQASIDVPGSSKGKTIHVILEVTDNGKPSLTRYRRIILNVGGVTDTAPSNS